MLNKKLIIPIIAAVLMALGVNLEKIGIDLEALSGSGGSTSSSTDTAATNNTAVYQSGAKWSNTSPELNLHHIFEGEINRKGKPTGFHSRPGGNDPQSAKVVRIQDGPNSAGVYTATIAVKDGNQWKEKFSSFFPDSFSADQVIEAIIHAYNQSSNKKKQPWQGPSGYGFTIQGYTTSRGGINTAFPVYRNN